MRNVVLQLIVVSALSAGLVTASRAQRTAPDFFADRSTFEFILYTDLGALLADRSLDSPERQGEVGYWASDSTPIWIPVEVKTRGLYRLREENCDFPPLRLDLPARELRGTIFDGQNKLKLVTHCRTDDPEFEQYVVLEYLAYRVYEILAPKSFRATLVKVMYADVAEEYEPITRYGFLVEDVDDLAARFGMKEVNLDGFHGLLADDFEMGVHDVFQYMIGNTDWSTILSHNVKFLQDTEENITVVPFDFDWSGAVAPPYAKPAPDVPTDDVRERFYMGVCRMTDHLTAVFQHFVEHKDAIYQLSRNETALGAEQRDRLLAYYDEFYETITDDRLAQQRIRDACRL